MDKCHQLRILDQWASNSNQVLSYAKCLQEIDKWINWKQLYEIGRRFNKIGPKGEQPRKPVWCMFRGLSFQYVY